MNRESQIEWAGRSFGPAVKSIKSTMALLLCATAALAAKADTDNRAPDVPAQIAVSSETNKVGFHGVGVGFQVYTWNGTSWGSAVPDATLFDEDGNIVATHFGVPIPPRINPAWQSNSGSKVIGALPPAAVIMDTNAIPWLRLQALTTEGPGVFADTTFIQRVNTTGGKAPFTDGAFVGQVARVPYTADYFFYRPSTD
jgi:hypothetical protein